MYVRFPYFFYRTKMKMPNLNSLVSATLDFRGLFWLALYLRLQAADAAASAASPSAPSTTTAGNAVPLEVTPEAMSKERMIVKANIARWFSVRLCSWNNPTQRAATIVLSPIAPWPLPLDQLLSDDSSAAIPTQARGNAHCGGYRWRPYRTEFWLSEFQRRRLDGCLLQHL